MTPAQGRQRACFRHTVRGRAIAPETARHAQQPLPVAPLACVRRIGIRVGQAVVHGTHAGGIRIAEKGQLQRRRSARECEQAVAAGVAGQIDQDIDRILLDQACRLRVVESADVAPGVAVQFSARCGYGRIAVAGDLIKPGLVQRQKRMDKVRRHMLKEIGRHVADAQPALGLPRVGKFAFAPQGIGDAPAPIEMLGGRLIGAGAVGQAECEQQAGARVGVVGLLCQAKAERLHRGGRLAAGHQGQGEVVMQRGIAAIDGERSAIRGDRIVQPGGLVREISEV